MGCGRDGVGNHQDDVVVAGFEAFELFESGVEGAAGGVDAVLQAGKGLVAFLECIGDRFEVLRTGVEELVP